MRRSTKGQVRLESIDYVHPVTCGYAAIHKWINRHYPRIGRCELCARRGKTHYASVRHDAYTRNRAHWLELCPSCHLNVDGFTGQAGRRKLLRSAFYAETSSGAGYQRGARHASWKGDQVSVKGIHQWMNKTFPRTGQCEHCGSVDRPTGYASVDHTYTRRREDWLELCVCCHRKFDNHGEKVRAAKLGVPLSEAHREACRRGQQARRARARKEVMPK